MHTGIRSEMNLTQLSKYMEKKYDNAYFDYEIMDFLEMFIDSAKDVLQSGGTIVLPRLGTIYVNQSKYNPGYKNLLKYSEDIKPKKKIRFKPSVRALNDLNPKNKKTKAKKEESVEDEQEKEN
jgi:nucleoid DNA-binding protein